MVMAVITRWQGEERASFSDFFSSVEDFSVFPRLGWRLLDWWLTAPSNGEDEDGGHRGGGFDDADYKDDVVDVGDYYHIVELGKEVGEHREHVLLVEADWSLGSSQPDEI